jgi:hypothetical protein
VHPTASCQPHPQVGVRTTTLRRTSTPLPSKPLLGGHRARHDAPPKARFARTAVHSVVLCAIPQHVARTVWHTCKLRPRPIKGGAFPWPQGEDGEHSPACFLPSPRYWHLPESKPLGPGGPASSPASLVAPPSASTTVQRNIVPRAHHYWTYGPGRNQDKSSVTSCLAPAIER